jgi:endonuclease/exonuclease/phosphatase family metal-dependent hydrolase
MSYSVSGDLEQYEEKPDKINPKQKMITIARKLKKGFEMRVPETFKLRKSLENSPYPVILCGDLNDTPVSYTYRQLIKTGLKDAFTESGRGYGNTYNGYLPKIRIDYIFASADYFELYNYHILQTSFSDHFPVSAFIQPVKKQ